MRTTGILAFSKAFENAEKLAVKFVKGLRHVHYELAPHRQCLFYSARRRIRGDLIRGYIIAQGLLNFPFSDIDNMSSAFE